MVTAFLSLSLLLPGSAAFPVDYVYSEAPGYPVPNPAALEFQISSFGDIVAVAVLKRNAGNQRSFDILDESGAIAMKLEETRNAQGIIQSKIFSSPVGAAIATVVYRYDQYKRLERVSHEFKRFSMMVEEVMQYDDKGLYSKSVASIRGQVVFERSYSMNQTNYRIEAESFVNYHPELAGGPSHELAYRYDLAGNVSSEILADSGGAMILRREKLIDIGSLESRFRFFDTGYTGSSFPDTIEVTAAQGRRIQKYIVARIVGSEIEVQAAFIIGLPEIGTRAILYPITDGWTLDAQPVSTMGGPVKVSMARLAEQPGVVRNTLLEATLSLSQVVARTTRTAAS